MADAQLQIVIDSIDNASKDLERLKKQLQGLTKETDKNQKSTGGLKEEFSLLKSGAVALAAGVAGTYVALKKFYDIAKQGAELQFVEDRFNRLSESIGTTADVLLGDLREATKGLRSDSELMASATDFMALGFAKTADEAVRLATVAGALNMNMNQLVLTLANQTTMRFDQLHVSLDGFNERLQALKASGMDVNAAFQEAFLQQAEEQIKKVGNAADSSAGSFMKFEAAAKNLGDAIKQGLVMVLEPAITSAGNALVGFMDQQQKANSVADQTRLVSDQLDAAFGAQLITLEELQAAYADMRKGAEKGVYTAESLARVQNYVKDVYLQSSDAIDQTAESTIALAIKNAQLKQKLDETRDATLSAREGVLAFGLASEQTAGMVDNFLEKAQIFKDDFGEAFDISKILGGSTGAVKMLMSELGLLGVKYTELKENLDMGFSAATLRLNVAINTVYESVAGKLKEALEGANLSIEQLKVGFGAIDSLLGSNFKMELELGIKVEEFANGLIDAIKKGKVEEYLLGSGQAFLTTTLKLDADVQAAKTAIAELEKVKAAVLTAALLMIDAQVDDAKVKEWKAPTKYGTVIYTPRFGNRGVEEFPDTGGGGNPANGQPVYAQAAGGMTLPHYWVGELGPEPFFPETNGRIVSNTQAVNALRSGGGGGEQAIVVNINTPFNFADRVWAEREIAPFIRDAMRKAGK